MPTLTLCLWWAYLCKGVWPLGLSLRFRAHCMYTENAARLVSREIWLRGWDAMWLAIEILEFHKGR